MGIGLYAVRQRAGVKELGLKLSTEYWRIYRYGKCDSN